MNPRGVQTFVLGEAEHRTAIAACLFQTIQQWSYREIALPILDFYDVFDRVGGPDLTRKTLRFVDREGQVVALRSDFTPQVAKTVATRLSETKGSLRLCYQGDVVRHEPPRAGAQADFWQVGAELVGVEGLRGDVEILAVILDALASVGLEDVVVALAHAQIIPSVLEGVSVSDAQWIQIRAALDRKNPTEVKYAVGDLPAVARDRLVKLTRLLGAPEVLDKATDLGAGAAAVVEELRDLESALQVSGVPGRRVIDLGDVRGTDYYTGVKFRIFVPGLGAEVGSGGRYDNLVEKFGNARPAVGCSLYLDRIAHHLAAETKDTGDGVCEVELAGSPAEVGAAIAQAREARRLGQRVRMKES